MILVPNNATVSSAYGRLQERVWKPHGIRLNTKIKVYKAAVLTTLLYEADSWNCYRRHVKMLDAFHMRHLRYLMAVLLKYFWPRAKKKVKKSWQANADP